MEHLSDNQILDALSQPPMDSPEVGRHLEACPSCRQRLEEFRQTWEVLGGWKVETPAIDLTEGILSRIRPRREVYLWQPRTLVRIAASILVGIGLGTLSALPIKKPISPQQVSEAMHLDVLDIHSSSGWAGPLLAGNVEN